MRTTSLLVLLLAASAVAGAQTVSCPPNLTAKGAPGWTLDGKVESGPHAFAAITIYNQDPKAEAAGFPAILAPDDEQTTGNKVVQTWNLKDYRDLPIMLVCQYRNTKATLTRELPAELKTCVFRFELTRNAQLLAKPEVKCQ